MTEVLCCLAAAALCWPSAGRRARPGRLRPVTSRRTLEPAGLADRPGAVGAAALLVAAVVALLSTPLVAVLAGVCAGAAVRALRRARREAAGRRQVQAVAEGLGVLAAELRAGRSLAEAADAAVTGCPDDAAGAALGRVLRIGAGPPSAAPTSPPGSADELAEVLTRVSAAVRLSARTGCSLAGVAAAVEDDLRARARAETELRSAVAGPRASAAVLAGLPVLGLLMGSGVGADPWQVLTTTGTGNVLLVGGVALEVAGMAWSARLVRRAVSR
jgi:tight adherence protein B